MAIFLHRLPFRKNAINFLTMAIFPEGNFRSDRGFSSLGCLCAKNLTIRVTF